LPTVVKSIPSHYQLSCLSIRVVRSIVNYHPNYLLVIEACIATFKCAEEEIVRVRLFAVPLKHWISTVNLNDVYSFFSQQNRLCP